MTYWQALGKCVASMFYFGLAGIYAYIGVKRVREAEQYEER